MPAAAPMPRALLLVLLLLGTPLLLPACATFDEVEGVPDALDWSYFRGSPQAVAEAARDVFTLGGYTVDAIGGEPGGRFVLRVTSTPAGVDFEEILIEPTQVRDYRARAQTIPRGDRLPRDLEVAISAQLPAGR
jgi:hypothetical protein